MKKNLLTVVLLATAGILSALTLSRDDNSTCMLRGDLDNPAVSRAAEEFTAIYRELTGTLPGEKGAVVELVLKETANPWHEEYGYSVKGDTLTISGNSSRALLYGIWLFYEEQCGVRWWTPWESEYPARKTLEVKDGISRTVRPTFEYRDFYYENAHPGLFFPRNRVNGIYAVTDNSRRSGGAVAFGSPYHVHTFASYIPWEVFDTHPEYFTEYQGKRIKKVAWNIGGQLCLTNPDVKRIFREKLLEYIKADRAATPEGGIHPRFYSITPNDSLGACDCPPCRKERNQYGESGYLLNFVNPLADAIREIYPDVMLETLVYEYYTDLPKGGILPSKNLMLRICTQWNDHAHALTHPNNVKVRKMVEDWSRICALPMIWEYGKTYNPPDDLALGDSLTLAATYRDYAKMGIKGVFVEDESLATGNFYVLKTWLKAKLMEDCSRDAEALLNDFLNGYYGEGGKYIRQALNVLNQAAGDHFVGWRATVDSYSFYTLDDLREAHRLFDAAAAAVKGDEAKIQRINFARLSLDRLTVFTWRNYQAQAAREGKKMLEGTIATYGERAIATLEQQKQLQASLLTGDWVNHIQPEINRLSSALKEADIPEFFSKFDADKVLMIGNGAMTIRGGHAKAVMDASGQLDYIVSNVPAKQTTYKCGSYFAEAEPGKNLNTAMPLTVDGEFKWRKVGTLNIYNRQYIYLSDNWSIQIPMGNYLSSQICRYDLYLLCRMSKDDKLWSVDIKRGALVNVGDVKELQTPEKFASHSVNKLVVIPESAFEIKVPAAVKRVTDNDSVSGKAISITLPAGKSAFKCGTYSAVKGAANPNRQLAFDTAISGYQWVEAKDMSFTNDHYIYFFDNWGVQIPLKPFLKRMIPEVGHGSIWLNVKAIPGTNGTELRISSAVVIWQ